MKTLIAILALMTSMAASRAAFAGGMNGEYSGGSVDYIVPMPDIQRFLVEQVISRQKGLLLLQVRDLKTGQGFQYWVTEDQVETGTDRAQFLKSGVIPAGA